MRTLHLYVDDSGTRHPDHQSQGFEGHDWFGLGGILVREEDEADVRARYAAFREEWASRVAVDVPLHSHEIRHGREAFGWLRTDRTAATRFYEGLNTLVEAAPFRCTACVIDRPGHRARYSGVYPPDQRWSLCRTAFSILIERTCKLAIREDRRLRVFVERSDKATDRAIQGYYTTLRTQGLPFDPGRMATYHPLSATEFAATLYDLKFKRKSSPPMQLADLCLYPICRAGYDTRGRDYEVLARDKLVDCVLAEGDVGQLGIKYSCFESVRTRHALERPSRELATST